jgi:hypothetical protein
MRNKWEDLSLRYQEMGLVERLDNREVVEGISMPLFRAPYTKK